MYRDNDLLIGWHCMLLQSWVSLVFRGDALHIGWHYMSLQSWVSLSIEAMLELSIPSKQGPRPAHNVDDLNNIIYFIVYRS